MTLKEEITAKIKALEIQIADYQAKVSELKNELSNTPAVNLERDIKAEALAETERKNEVLRKRGFLPATESKNS